MATEGDVELELETETSGPERPPEKPRKHDSGAADLERVTDYAEEKEIQSSNLETAMSVIGDRRSREQKAKQEREKELAKVTIKKEDLELISTGSGRAGSAAMAHAPSRSAACGIFLDRGTNPCPLHRQADSQPLRHQGSPPSHFLMQFRDSLPTG
ncbi:huntingtin-interacting protein K isoform X1 [Kogia breviceps]|uniref:huntingtin-interacting protein K isoform X1 n=1 Tax=Kogia breviceps TaxID=27615 RepID=UPI0034D1AC1D